MFNPLAPILGVGVGGKRVKLEHSLRQNTQIGGMALSAVPPLYMKLQGLLNLDIKFVGSIASR